LFCDGSHGEFEILNDFSVCWEIESWRFERKNKRVMKKLRIGRDMILVFVLKDEWKCCCVWLRKVSFLDEISGGYVWVDCWLGEIDYNSFWLCHEFVRILYYHLQF
jgi:hypothetical protein